MSAGLVPCSWRDGGHTARWPRHLLCRGCGGQARSPGHSRVSSDSIASSRLGRTSAFSASFPGKLQARRTGRLPVSWPSGHLAAGDHERAGPTRMRKRTRTRPRPATSAPCSVSGVRKLVTVAIRRITAGGLSAARRSGSPPLRRVGICGRQSAARRVAWIAGYDRSQASRCCCRCCRWLRIRRAATTASLGGLPTRR